MLIQNGIVLTMESDQPAKLDLLIRNGKIARMTPAIPPGENEVVFGI
ncbi:MAG: hypothetical protein IJO67_05625 [Clostridia bacterium]|nr:hypothetical protein [Clostridia bacterium]